MSFKSFVSKTYGYMVLVPILMIVLGAASNQAVLIANHGKFPVMMNERQLQNFESAAAQDAGAQQQVHVTVNGVTVIVTASRRSHFSVWHTALSSVRPNDVNGQFLDDVHSVMGPNSHLKAQADIWNLGSAIWSVGDFGIEFGGWLLGFGLPMWLILALRKLALN